MEIQHNYAFIAIGVAGIAMNALEIIMILKGGQYRLPFQMSLLSLAVADMLAALSLTLWSNFVLLLKLGYPVPKMLTYYYIRAVIFSSISSQLHVIFITIQRMIAVLLPFSCKRILTQFRCFLVLALLWIASLGATGLINDIPDTVALTIITGVLIAFSYAFIVYRIRNRPVVVTRDSSLGSDVTLYSGILFLLFVACYFPFSFFHIIHGAEKGNSGQFIAVYYFYWLNTLTNPVVYCLFKSFKGGAKCFKSKGTANCVPDAC